MTTFKTFLILMTLGSNAYAADDWLCRSQSSQKRGDSILACGVGTAINESEARLNALNAAKNEFIGICDLSKDCKGRDVNAQPERTECELTSAGYKCYRLIVFEIKTITPSQSKFKSGVAVTQLLGLVGSPVSVSEITDYLDGTKMQQLFYTGEVCAYKFCSVLARDGKIVKFNDVKTNLIGF